MNTKISYFYRDADNYKAHHSVILKGKLSAKQISEILNKLEGGEMFIPRQVDLPPLQEQLKIYDTQDWGTDHEWHELDKYSFENTSEKPTEEFSATQFHKLFISIEKWEEFEPPQSIQYIMEE